MYKVLLAVVVLAVVTEAAHIRSIKHQVKIRDIIVNTVIYRVFTELRVQHKVNMRLLYVVTQ